MKLRYVTLAVIVFSTLPCYAVTINQPERTLLVRHSKPGTVTIEGGAPGPASTLATKLSFTRRHDETVRVAVDDPNPLVFTYKWKGVTKSQTADYTAALEFAGSLREMAASFGKFKVDKPQNAAAGDSAIPTVGSRAAGILKDEGIDDKMLRQFTKDLTQLSDWADQISALTTKSAGSKESAETVKTTVLAWDVEVVATREQQTMKKISTASDHLLSRLMKSDEPALDSEAASQSVGNTDSPPSTGTAPVSGKAKGAKAKPPAKDKGEVVANKIADDDLVIAFLLATGKSQQVSQLGTAVRGFVTTAKGINERLTFEPIEYSASEDVTGALEIGPAPGAKGSDVEQRVTGMFAFAMSPYSPATLRNIAPAVLYSFVEAAEYSTKLLPSGKYQIIRTDTGNAVNGLTLAAMLSLTPHSWSNPTVGGSFQIGLSPVKDRIAVLGGATLNVFDLFSLGAGIVYQQTHRLARGLREDQDDLPSADALKTTTGFKPGFYLSITVKPK